jgi:hypothetical protein
MLSEYHERATRSERADAAARESACRGVRGAKPLGLRLVASNDGPRVRRVGGVVVVMQAEIDHQLAG